MNRGEIWIADVGRKRRPVLVLTRQEVIDVRALVTVSEITTTVRGLASEVEFDYRDAGIDRPSVVNCDGLHTVPKASLVAFAGALSDEAMDRVCSAATYALGC